MALNLIWVDSNIDNEENSAYLEILKNYVFLKVKYFKEVDEAINKIKEFEFIEIIIIISGRLYIKFIENFKKNLKDIYIIQKIIIFTGSKTKFIEYNKQYKELFNHPFYNLGGIKTSFNEVKQFILNEIELYKSLNEVSSNDKIDIYNNKILDRDDEGSLTFEYIDCKEKLALPILYKSLVEYTIEDKMYNTSNNINNKYSKDIKSIKLLLNPIKSINDIPIEILSKYYARIYTAKSENNKNFYSEINRNLRKNKKEKYYLPYIKTLYEGLKLKSLLIYSNNILYKGTSLLNKEIKIIKNYLKNKINDLPGAIVFSKSFLSFSKEREISENFLNKSDINKDMSKVLFILEKEENIDYSLATHADIEKYHFFIVKEKYYFFHFHLLKLKI